LPFLAPYFLNLTRNGNRKPKMIVIRHYNVDSDML
jgi:hypothetical protein